MKILVSVIALLLSMVVYGEYRYGPGVTAGAADLSEVVQHSHGGEPHDDEPEDDEPEDDEPEGDEPDDDDPDA
ncbi:MAG: hypothetical protein VW642_07785 [Halieaceae bacterium]